MHTPGPWKMAEILEGDYNPDSELPDNRPVTHYIVAAYDDNLLITYGLPATDRSDEFFANACLIAAAPELLEALKHLDNAINEPSLGIDLIEASDRARAAIAKAEGVQP